MFVELHGAGRKSNTKSHGNVENKDEEGMDEGMQFYKNHGLGNDYLVHDSNKNRETLKRGGVIKICDRNFGLGSDGILAGLYHVDGKVSVKIFNPDGSEAEKSGNGVRIFAKYLKDAGYVTTDQFNLHTLGGDVFVKYKNDTGTNITVSMGNLNFSREAIGAVNVPDEVVNTKLMSNDTAYNCTCVLIGNLLCNGKKRRFGDK